jgi:glycosyltransferase involved in cell wall biosynthesis
VPLKVVGDGPLAPLVRQAEAQSIGVEWLGRQPPEAVYELIGAAACLVLASACYENFPRVVVEAFAKGTPVIVSDIGALGRIVDHGRTGLKFAPGDATCLAAQVRRLCDDPVERDQMRGAARREFEEKYTAESNYRTLMGIYEAAEEDHGVQARRSRSASEG